MQDMTICSLLTSHLPDMVFLLSFGSCLILRKGNAHDAVYWERKHSVGYTRAYLLLETARKKGHLIRHLPRWNFCPISTKEINTFFPFVPMPNKGHPISEHVRGDI